MGKKNIELLLNKPCMTFFITNRQKKVSRVKLISGENCQKTEVILIVLINFTFPAVTNIDCLVPSPPLVATTNYNWLFPLHKSRYVL